MGKQTVFITGASRGIGKAIADVFAESRATLVTPLRRELDLESNTSIDRYFEDNPALNISTAVFNAGINLKATLEDYDIETYMRVFQVNVFSSVRILKYLLPRMKAANYGKVVFISSLYASVSKEQRGAYSASKTALTGLVRTLSLECAPYNIMVNAVAPGYVDTAMTRQNLTPSEIEAIVVELPTHRLQTEREIADAVAFLCSEQNRSITGQLLNVDGGFLCR